jgi:hypothetical protein
LRDFPQVFRILQQKIPVRFEDDGSALARRVIQQLRKSSRFREDPAGFRIVVRDQDKTLKLEMYQLANVLHFEALLPKKDAEEQILARAGRRFHQWLMSPGLDLSDVEINSLLAVPSSETPGNLGTR